MLTRVLGFLGRIFPQLKRTFWKRLYERMARDRDPEWLFMNYGFTDAASPALQLDPADEVDRLAIQLYHHVIDRGELQGKDVLEVGCGRGGGVGYMAKYVQPRSLIGLDLSPRALTLSRVRGHAQHVQFVCGDAGALPFPSATFDAVVNVESSHCYPAMENFLAEVFRVLRPAGLMLYADLRFHEAVGRLRTQVRAPGFRVLRERDITRNVLQALELDTPRRAALINRKVPGMMRGPIQAFAGMAGTRFYEMLARGRGAYLSFVLEKPA